MAGLVNVTVLVQISNFIITYMLLSKFFFKPLISKLDTKERAKNSLMTKLKEKELLLSQLEKEKALNLTAFRNTIKERLALLPPADSLSNQPHITAELDSDECSELLKKTTALLKKKVPDVV